MKKPNRREIGVKVNYTKINHPKETYDMFLREKRTYYERFAKARGISLEQYLRLLDKHSQTFIPKDSKVCMRIRADTLKEVIQSNDFFKPRYITDTSWNPARRLINEKNRLGNYSQDVPGEFRPIFGYIATREQPLGKKGRERYLDRYGDVAIVFKDEVREHTSFTVGDSARSNVKAVPLERPNGDCFAVDTSVTAKVLFEFIRSQDPLDNRFGNVMPYVEAQIHYPHVSLQNIEYVVLTGSAAHNKDLITRLKKANIPYIKITKKQKRELRSSIQRHHSTCLSQP